MTLKLGIIGCGGMGLRHMHGISELMKYSENPYLMIRQTLPPERSCFLLS